MRGGGHRRTWRSTATLSDTQMPFMRPINLSACSHPAQDRLENARRLSPQIKSRLERIATWERPHRRGFEAEAQRDGTQGPQDRRIQVVADADDGAHESPAAGPAPLGRQNAAWLHCCTACHTAATRHQAD